MPLTEVISVKDPESPKKAALILKRGGVIIYPTETLYGIGAFASINDPVESEMFSSLSPRIHSTVPDKIK